MAVAVVRVIAKLLTGGTESRWLRNGLRWLSSNGSSMSKWLLRRSATKSKRQWLSARLRLRLRQLLMLLPLHCRLQQQHLFQLGAEADLADHSVLTLLLPVAV